MMHQIVDSRPLTTLYGEFLLDVFYDGRQESAVLRCGELRDKDEVLCRIQSACLNQYFFDLECDCNEQIACSLAMINEEREQAGGLVILLPQEGKGNGFGGQNYREVEDLRDYRSAAKIIKDRYRIGSVRLISSNKRKISELKKHGVDIQSTIWYQKRYFFFSPALERIVTDVEAGHSICPIGYERHDREPSPECGTYKTRVLVCGDLNVDHFMDEPPSTSVGGSAYNASCAFQKLGFTPVLFGAVGGDDQGKSILETLKHEPYHVAVRVNREPVSEVIVKPKSTTVVRIHNTGNVRHPFHHDWDTVDNANDYSAEFLRKTIRLMDLNENDFVFVTSYLFLQKQWNHEACVEFFQHVAASGARVVLDLARSSFKPCKATGKNRTPPVCDAYRIRVNFC